MRSEKSMKGHLRGFELVDQELALLKSGYSSRSKQWFESYGLSKLGYPKFLK
jgi:hypothetical protein